MLFKKVIGILNFELLSALAQKRSKDFVGKYPSCDNNFGKYV